MSFSAVVLVAVMGFLSPTGLSDFSGTVAVVLTGINSPSYLAWVIVDCHLSWSISINIGYSQFLIDIRLLFT
jgi:hypothetical protein